MRKSRIFRLVVRIFLLIFTISLSVVSILGGLSAVNILSNSDNFSFDFDNVEFNFNASDPSQNNITVPFSFNNDGYFDLTKMELTIDIYLTYKHVNYTTPGENVTRTAKLFTADYTEAIVLATTTHNGVFFGDSTNFLDVPDEDEIDSTAPTDFFMDILLSAKYSHELLTFSIEINNRPLIPL